MSPLITRVITHLLSGMNHQARLGMVSCRVDMALPPESGEKFDDLGVYCWVPESGWLWQMIHSISPNRCPYPESESHDSPCLGNLVKSHGSHRWNLSVFTSHNGAAARCGLYSKWPQGPHTARAAPAQTKQLSLVLTNWRNGGTSKWMICGKIPI